MVRPRIGRAARPGQHPQAGDEQGPRQHEHLGDQEQFHVDQEPAQDLRRR